jgi:predicted outer membrane protein
MSRLWLADMTSTGAIRMKLIKAFALGAILATGAAHAEEEPTDPQAIARAELMKMVGMNTGILGNMASGK